MAVLHPADIDETEPMCISPDPVVEQQIHSAIDRFWSSQKYIMPSPQVIHFIEKLHMKLDYKEMSRRECNYDGFISESSRNHGECLQYQPSPLVCPTRARCCGTEKSKHSVEVQTMFTFPPNLDLVGLLGLIFF
ncbi:unnamed protein product [Gongylonema pulchrum]|uniref:Protein aurora borealis n=1 Tax=Gongylonema pulchrum TaxID=637853 RepID=A0A183DH01_9BILA|nr:unnamed protein product [Gongylonema pulchrum]